MLKRTASAIAIVAMFLVVGTARAQDSDLSDIDGLDTHKSASVAGCWQGNVFNTAFCSSECLFTLFFTQKGSSISKHGSTYEIDYDERAPIMNMMSGKSSAAKTFPVKFHGVAFGSCKIHFLGNLVDSTHMDGNFRFSGPCTDQQFASGDFSVTFLGSTCP